MLLILMDYVKVLPLTLKTFNIWVIFITLYLLLHPPVHMCVSVYVCGLFLCLGSLIKILNRLFFLFLVAVLQLVVQEPPKEIRPATQRGRERSSEPKPGHCVWLYSHSEKDKTWRGKTNNDNKLFLKLILFHWVIRVNQPHWRWVTQKDDVQRSALDPTDLHVPRGALQRRAAAVRRPGVPPHQLRQPQRPALPLLLLLRLRPRVRRLPAQDGCAHQGAQGANPSKTVQRHPLLNWGLVLSHQRNSQRGLSRRRGSRFRVAPPTMKALTAKWDAHVIFPA